MKIVTRLKGSEPLTPKDIVEFDIQDLREMGLDELMGVAGHLNIGVDDEMNRNQVLTRLMESAVDVSL